MSKSKFSMQVDSLIHKVRVLDGYSPHGQAIMLNARFDVISRHLELRGEVERVGKERAAAVALVRRWVDEDQGGTPWSDAVDFLAELDGAGGTDEVHSLPTHNKGAKP